MSETAISQRSPLLTLCLTILMHCVWRCRQRLYATAGDSVLPAVHYLSQSTDFLLLFFTAILVPKKEKKRKCGCIFQPKNKTPKNKKMRFLAPKNKPKKTKFGRPLVSA